MTDVTLVPMTAQDLDAFIREEIADWADERVCDGTWSRGEALGRAQAELTMVAAWERQAATAERQRLLTAINTIGMHVGWLWVKRGPPGPWSSSAFLCQMTVARACRHQGYGRSILGALEELLSSEGIAELLLNVRESNRPATSLYDSAGYETAGRYAMMRQLRKRLHGGRLTSGTVAHVG